MLELFSIHALPDSFSISKTGAITSKIYIEAGKIVFPEKEWNDFTVIILGWWLEQLQELYSGNTIECHCRFMDGPFQFDVVATSKKDWIVSFVRRNYKHNEHLAEILTTSDRLTEAILSTSNSVIKLCSQQGWETEEVLTLIRNYTSLREMKK